MGQVLEEVGVELGRRVTRNIRIADRICGGEGVHGHLLDVERVAQDGAELDRANGLELRGRERVGRRLGRVLVEEPVAELEVSEPSRQND